MSSSSSLFLFRKGGGSVGFIGSTCSGITRRKYSKTIFNLQQQQHYLYNYYYDYNNKNHLQQQTTTVRSAAVVGRVVRHHSSSSSPKTGGGIGLHNVRERVIPSTRINDDGSTGGTPSLFRHTNHVPQKTCHIIGAPMTHGQPYVGTDITPQLLRQNNLVPLLTALEWKVIDSPDLQFKTVAEQYYNNNQTTQTTSSTIMNGFYKAKNTIEVGTGCELLAQQVYDTLQSGHFPLILGGDHSIGLGSLAGILKHSPNVGILWIDAHADINTPRTSESGNLHGMPIGMLLEPLQNQHYYNSDNTNKSNKNNHDNDNEKMEKKCLPGFEWIHHHPPTTSTGESTSTSSTSTSSYPRLKPNSIVYIGLRDVDRAERQIIQKYNIKTFTMTDIDHYGIGNVMDQAFEYLYSNGGDNTVEYNAHRPIHLSYDIDAVDPVLAPATGTAVRGGLTYREAMYVAEAVCATGNLVSAEIVELNPTLAPPTPVPTNSDNNKTPKTTDDTIELGLQIITSLMGKSII